MKRFLFGALFAFPIGVFCVAGVVWMWQHSLLLAGLVMVFACWSGGVLLMRRRLSRLGSPQPIPEAWTARDREALALVEAREQLLLQASPGDLADRSFYEKQVYDLALQLARHYHPNSEDPFAPLTPRQLVVVANVIAGDVGDWLDYYFPGNRLITIGQFRRLGELPSWMSALAKWTSIGARWARSGGDASGVGVADSCGGEPSRGRGTMSLLVSRMLMRKLGVRLIDLYAGRLHDEPPCPTRPQRSASDAQPASPRCDQVTIAFVGERGSGKSSMIQAMLGDGRSTRDRLPGATHVSRYRVQLGEPLARLVVLEADLVLNTISRDLRWIAETSDVVVFVCKATASMDEARAILRTLVKDGRADTAVVTAVSHIDRVAEPTDQASRPMDIDSMEVDPVRTLKESMGPWEAEFEGISTDFAPVSTKPGQGIGVEEWLLPSILRQLSEVKANILLRALEISEQTAHEK